LEHPARQLKHLDEEALVHVAISGAGIGGLCLAQGLARIGVEVTVFETEPAITRAGYRLHMNADGGNALRQCLTADAYRLYQQTSRVTPRRELLTFIDSEANEVATRPHIGPPNDGPMPHTAVNRRTLRQILLAGVEDRVRFGERTVDFAATEDGVEIFLQSGESVTADVLVAAEGLYSTTRSQLLGAPEVVDTRLGSLYGRAALPDSLAETLPPELFDGFVFATGPDGRFLTFGAWQPRQDVAEAAAKLAPNAAIDPVEPYLQVTLNIPPEGPLAYPGDASTATGTELHEFWMAGVRGWSPVLVDLVDRMDPASIFLTRIRGIRPAPAWAPSRVTVLGDAVHAMPPTFGAGANTALKDAATLARHLQAAVSGESSIVEAIGAYEAEMRAYAYPVLEMSLDPKAFDADM
jgi:salicylate hydroxylase